MGKLRMRFRKNKDICLFLLPLLIIIFVFLIYPIYKAFVMSLQYWYLPKPKPDGNPFIGLSNYRNIFKSEYFTNSLLRTFIFIIVTVSIRYIIGLGSALLLNTKFKGRGIARALIIIPWAMPQVVACLVWILMYDGQFGIINYLLMKFNMINQNIAYLDNPSTAFAASMAVTIWKGFPFVSIMLLAGLQSIPKELYEACEIDGANAWQRFWHVTIPMLKPVSSVVFMLLVIWTIKDFAIVYVLASGGPSRATELTTVYIYHQAFKYFNFGEAAAGGMIMLIFSLIFSAFYLRALKGGENV